jgi:signal transduction histidine kinase
VTESSETVLVAAALPRDVELTVRLLAGEGYSVAACRDLRELAEKMPSAGAAIVTEELLDRDGLPALAAACAAQPAWSDLPILVFTADRTAAGGGNVVKSLVALGNVTLVERPVRMSTLLSAVAAALRSRRRQYEVRSLVRELEDAVFQRDRFLAMLGHELRNPLSALLTAAHVAELLVRQGGGAELKAAFGRQHGIIRRQGQTLTRLMDDLLDVSRLRTGKVRVVLEPVDLREVLARVWETAAAAADRRGIALLPLPAGGPLPVMGDVTRLEQVFHNLLHNAVKYTKRGGTVRAEVQESPSRIEVEVHDTGVGIEPELLPRIFDLFRQVDHTLDRSEGGLGLGLTLAKSLVDLHGGELVARSEGLGRGCTFTVRLPRSARRPAPSPAPAASTGEGARDVCVFVLEDREDNREALVVALGALGCRVISASDGGEGVELILEHKPRVAIVDIGLPGLDGYAVARRVRSALGQAIFLIALTGYGQEDDRRRAAQAGFDVHLTKPADLERIAEILAALPSAV